MVTYFFNVVIMSFMFCIFGLIFDLKYFSDGLFVFNFFTLLVNGMIVGLIPFCVTAAVNNKNLGMSILYGFVLYSIVMQWLFSGGFIL